MTQEEAEKKIRHVRVALKLAVAFFSAVGIFDVYNILYIETVIVPDPKEWHSVALTIVFPCEMALISSFLACAYCYLSVNIKQYFAKELQDEGRRIRAIFIFFSLSYISRAVVFLLC